MKLFEEYPLPWSIEIISPTIVEWRGSGGYIIRDANQMLVIHGGTYTGDGDLECNFTYLQAKELVEIVNTQQNVQRTALPCGHDANNLRMGVNGYGCAECESTRR